MLFLYYLQNWLTDFQTVFFLWKLSSIWKFLTQNQFFPISGGRIICKTKPGSKIDKYIFIRTWSSPHSTIVALRGPDQLLTGPAILWEALRGPKLPQLVSQGVSWPLRGLSGHLKATLMLWGPPQASVNMYLYISEPGFNLQISQPPEIAQNWFCIQNLHMDPSFQK